MIDEFSKFLLALSQRQGLEESKQMNGLFICRAGSLINNREKRSFCESFLLLWALFLHFPLYKQRIMAIRETLQVNHRQVFFSSYKAI